MLSEFDGEINQVFGFRSRDEDVVIYLESAVVEVFGSEDVCERFSGLASSDYVV